MESITTLFAPLHAAIAQKNQQADFDIGHPWRHALQVDLTEGLLDIEYCGEHVLWLDSDGDDAADVLLLRDLLCLLASPQVAPRLHSFIYRTVAALATNGTYDYDIDPLVEGEQSFPRLTRLLLDQGDGAHGYKILTSPLHGDEWAEAGVLARMLEKAPALTELVTPSAPNADFFHGHPHPLQSLDVDAAYGHEDFIRNLAACSRFPQLRRLVFTDYRQTYMNDWREQATRFEDYLALFASPLATQLETICLREVSLGHDQVQQLLAMRSAGVTITFIKAD